MWSVVIALIRLKNNFYTFFGWTRINVLVALICFTLVSSFCFTLLIAAIQAFVHISHHHKMHYPIFVFVTGFIGLILNAMCQIFIGGYTFSQDSFVYMQLSANIIINNNQIDLCKEPCIISENSVPMESYRRNPTLFEAFRDSLGN